MMQLQFNKGKLRLWLSFVCIVSLSIMLSACRNDKDVKLKPYDPILAEYLPTDVAAFLGDGGYYHVVKELEKTESTSAIQVELNGEILDNSSGVSQKDYLFDMQITVDHEKMTLTYSGSELNESEFSEVVLLKLPLEVGNTWTFSARNKADKTVKVTAKIVEVDENQDIKVKYSIKDGYYEERILAKGMGVTDFVRLVQFGKESTWTGYHIETEYHVPPPNQTLPEEISIDTGYYSLILGFEQAWTKYILSENDEVLGFLAEGSKAMEKVKSLERTSDFEYSFKSFYPFEFTNEDPVIQIKIVEIYEDLQNVESINKIQFTIQKTDDGLKIIDFERVD